MLNTVDLFCGGGGLSLGLQYAGFNVVEAFDNWQPAIDFYATNIKNHKITKTDLLDADAISAYLKKIPNLDVIAGGPPCQDFSSAGKRNENGGRASLTLSFARIIASVKPRILIMENVARAIKSKTFFEAMKIFKSAGYGITQAVLDASRCNVPQIRKRVFVVGFLDRKNDTLLARYAMRMSDKPMTLRDYFGDSLGIDFYYRHPRSYARRGIFSIDEPSPTVRGVNRPMPAGYPGHKGDAAPVSSKIRSLTTKERSMIQTFPANWILCGNKSDLEQIIGNAVPVNLAKFVGDCIVSELNNEKRENKPIPYGVDTTFEQLMLLLEERNSSLSMHNKKKVFNS